MAPKKTCLPRTVLPALVSLLALLAPATPASAADFTVDITCTYLARTGEYWQAPLSPGAWSKYCLPDGVGMGLRATGGMSEDLKPTYWQFPKISRAGISIKHVSAVVRGGNGSAGGLAQGLQLARTWSGGLKLGPLVTLPEPSAGDERTIELDGSDVEGGADKLLLSGRCTITVCSVQDPFEVVSLKVTFADNGLPTLNAIPSYVASSGGWVNSFTLALYDADSGIARLDIAASNFAGEDAHVRRSNQIDCRQTSSEPYFCVTTRGAVTQVDDFESSFWHVGLNHLTLTAYDLAGNAAARTFDFSIDRESPAAPQGLKFDSERFPGWISNPNGVIRWRNKGELGAGNQGSGIDRAVLELIPLDNQASSTTVNAKLDPTEESAVELTFPASGTWRVEVKVLDAAGNVSVASVKTIAVDGVVPPPPNIEMDRWYGPERPTVTWKPPNATRLSPSGVCDYETSVDGALWSSTGGRTAFDFDRGVGGGAHTVSVRSVSCAALKSDADESTLIYDEGRPTVKAQASREGWMTEDDELTITADDDESGVDRIQYSVGDSADQLVASAQAHVSSLPEGAQSVKYLSVDKVGNRSLQGSTTLYVDKTPPSGWLEPFDGDRPTLVSGVVTDANSGVLQSKLQYRPFGSGDWIDLATDHEPLGGQSLRLQARIPDHDLPAGPYELRLMAIDRAGHVFVSGGERIDGTPAFVRTPLRQNPRISASMVESVPVRCKRVGRSASDPQCLKQRDVEDTIVDFGKWSTMRGRLVDAGGVAIAHARVVVLADEEPIDGRRSPIADAETDHDGLFDAAIPPGVNRKLYAVSPGSERTMPAEDSAVVRTRSSISLTVSRRRARPGQTIVFTGRVRLGSASLSNLGLHYLITSVDGEVSIKDRRTDPSGRFSVSYVVPRFGHPVTLRLRAAVRHEYGWPYSGGASKPLSIRVTK